MNFRIYVVDQSTLKPIYNYNSSIAYNSNNVTFANVLTNSPAFSGKSLTVDLTTFDYNGGNTKTTNLPIYTYIWTVTVTGYRPSTLTELTFDTSGSNLINTVNTTTKPTLIYNFIQAHSPPIGGTFTLKINNIPITIPTFSPLLNANIQVSDIPYNITRANFLSYIKTSLDVPSIELDFLGIPE